MIEFATLHWVDWFNTRRLLEPIGYVPPAEYEARYYAVLAESDESEGRDLKIEPPGCPRNDDRPAGHAVASPRDERLQRHATAWSFSPLADSPAAPVRPQDQEHSRPAPGVLP
jgi:hypothetical protein